MESSHILHSDKDQQILFRYKGSEVPMLFNKTDNSENCPSLGGPLHPNHGFFGPPTQSPKWHLDRFSRFHRAQERDQQTDTHTDRLLRYAGRTVVRGGAKPRPHVTSVCRNVVKFGQTDIHRHRHRHKHIQTDRHSDCNTSHL